MKKKYLGNGEGVAVKSKVLIVDDSELNRSLLTDLLGEQFSIIEAENGLEAAAILHEREHEIHLILLDIVMPEMDGLEFLALMNRKGWIKTIPVIMISAETVPACIDRAYDLGVMDYISRPFDERTVQRRVSNSIILAARQRELSHMVTDQLYERERDNRLMIEILSNIVEFRNGESGLHVLHIHTITEILLKRLIKRTDKYGLTAKDVSLICNASSLHDIGKIGIPSEILNKPGRLTKEEFEIMKTHSEEGAKILGRITLRKEEPLLHYGYEICRWHHERYDGKGYPDGLKGDEIPISAQIVALADVYDALTSKRVYKDAYSHEKTIRMILDGECGQFNPLLLECLVDVSEVLKKELAVLSLGRRSDEELLSNVEETVANGNLDVSERTFKLLEREREKVRFYSSYSREICFEYTAVPEMILLSEESAAYLEMPETIANPGEQSFGNGLFEPADFRGFLEELEHAAPENPIVDKTYVLTIKDQKCRHRVVGKSLWAIENPLEYEGAIVKIIDI